MQDELNPRRTLKDLRAIRERECKALSGLSRGTRYRMERDGTFPPKIKLGDRSSGWHAWMIREWLESRAPAALLVCFLFIRDAFPLI